MGSHTRDAQVRVASVQAPRRSIPSYMVHRTSPKPALPVSLTIVETILVFARLRVTEKGELACVRIEEGECIFYRDD